MKNPPSLLTMLKSAGRFFSYQDNLTIPLLMDYLFHCEWNIRIATFLTASRQTQQTLEVGRN